MNDIIGKFTNHLKSVLTRALTLVIEQNGQSIEPEHLLWALSTQNGSVAEEILTKAGITSKKLNELTKQNKGTNTNNNKNSSVPNLSDESKTAIEKAVTAASTYEHRYVGTEHLLSGLLKSDQKTINDFFKNIDADLNIMNQDLETIFSTTASFPNLNTKTNLKDSSGLVIANDKNSQNNIEDQSNTPALDYFTEELTHPDAAAEVDQVIGRELEITRLMQILSRRSKNNPILVGEPGVGKTAIVEGLAKHIVEGNVPDILSGKRIFRLDIASLIAGTMYRGEFESRLKQLIEEIEDMPEAILFIDEVHIVMGAGASSGSLDAANMLKPALARGSIHCIGATTSSEYKKFIETDGALERRFQSIRVLEPTKEKTKKILLGIKKYYEEYHRVSYTDGSINSSIALAERYMTGKYFPDKAIDLLDEAGASANLSRPCINKTENKNVLEKELSLIKEEKRIAVEKEQFKKATKLKSEEKKLLHRINSETTKTKEKIIDITDEDIMRVVAEITGIPITQIDKKGKTQLTKLAKELQKQVIGQNKTIDRVAKALIRARLGIAPTNRPLSSFLFVGPSGVGKTKLAKSISKILFHNNRAFLRLDMSEFSERFTMSKLIGAPAGYVGYRESSLLTDHVKQYPHSVILFDELEKAHSDIGNILLQILDEGRLTDATGREINFKNTIIIMTSNVGGELFEQSPLGFNKDDNSKNTLREETIRSKIQERFSRELVNRIAHVCTFQPLTKKSLELIVKKQLIELQDRLQELEIKLLLQANTAQIIASKTTIKFGARDIARIIEQEIEHPLTEAILKRKNGEKMHFALRSNSNGAFNVLHKLK